MGFFAGKIYTQVIKLLTWWMALLYIWIQSDFLYHSTTMAWCYKKKTKTEHNSREMIIQIFVHLF